MAMSRRTASVLGAAAALVTTPALVEGGPMATCLEQDNCMDWTVEKSTECEFVDGVCDASFKVCVTVGLFDSAHPNCPKKDGSLSHYCNTGECYQQRPPPFGPKVEGKTLPFIQCQHGKADEELTFVFKDGPSCGRDKLTRSLEVCDGASVTINCAARKAGETTCEDALGRQGQEGKECIWKVKLPPSACPDCITTTTTVETTPEEETTTTTESTTGSTSESTEPSTGAPEDTTTSDQESMSGVAIDPLGNLGLAEVGGNIAAGGMPALAFVAAAGVASAVAASLIALGRRARARTSEHEPLQPATPQD